VNPAGGVAERMFHIAAVSRFEAAQAAGVYTPPTFGEEGFIHCSYAGQVCGVANRIFRGRGDLVLLEIDPGKLSCRVIDENLEGGAELFPHIYGPLPLDAITQVYPFPSRLDGAFDMPPLGGSRQTPRNSI
jgi:uncharacterized protein (DUF952 family)